MGVWIHKVYRVLYDRLVDENDRTLLLLTLFTSHIAGCLVAEG